MQPRESLSERGAIGEIRMQHLAQLGVRDAKALSADGEDLLDAWVLERISQGVATDHA
jgi:hypothetical protein